MCVYLPIASTQFHSSCQAPPACPWISRSVLNPSPSNHPSAKQPPLQHLFHLHPLITTTSPIIARHCHSPKTVICLHRYSVQECPGATLPQSSNHHSVTLSSQHSIHPEHSPLYPAHLLHHPHSVTQSSTISIFSCSRTIFHRRSMILQ